MVYKFFDRKTQGAGYTDKGYADKGYTDKGFGKELTDELHKKIVKKFLRRKVEVQGIDKIIDRSRRYATHQSSEQRL